MIYIKLVIAIIELLVTLGKITANNMPYTKKKFKTDIYLSTHKVVIIIS